MAFYQGIDIILIAVYVIGSLVVISKRRTIAGMVLSLIGSAAAGVLLLLNLERAAEAAWVIVQVGFAILVVAVVIGIFFDP